MTGYRYLFSPLRLGPLTLANRIVFAAHLTNYAADGLTRGQRAAPASSSPRSTARTPRTGRTRS
jgi:2,4-dienoyl-CoA reductase-like NADH-dependent reductase (Old Yellow Enzyme family)